MPIKKTKEERAREDRHWGDILQDEKLYFIGHFSIEIPKKLAGQHFMRTVITAIEIEELANSFAELGQSKHGCLTCTDISLPGFSCNASYIEMVDLEDTPDFFIQVIAELQNDLDPTDVVFVKSCPIYYGDLRQRILDAHTHFATDISASTFATLEKMFKTFEPEGIPNCPNESSVIRSIYEMSVESRERHDAEAHRSVLEQLPTPDARHFH